MVVFCLSIEAVKVDLETQTDLKHIQIYDQGTKAEWVNAMGRLRQLTSSMHCKALGLQGEVYETDLHL